MKILFIGIEYHNYTDAILAEMEHLGAEVTFVDIQPRSLPFKALRTLARPLYEHVVQRHLRAAVSVAESIAYDKVVFLQVHQMALETLEALRRAQPQAEFSLYNWDSIATHDYRAHAPLFDRILTFDRRDAAKHGYGYLPLFCIRPWQERVERQVSTRSVYMVGNVVGLARYHAVEAFREYCLRERVLFRQHLKISPVVLIQALRAGIRPRGVTLKVISEQKFREIIETSNAAFDFANHAQSGQTMRMMESLCAGKKVVTSNVWVRQEPFFSPDRIHVFDGLDFSGVAEFLDRPLVDPDAQFPEYHVQMFTRRLIGLEPVLVLDADCRNVESLGGHNE